MRLSLGACEPTPTLLLNSRSGTESMPHDHSLALVRAPTIFAARAWVALIGSGRVGGWSGAGGDACGERGYSVRERAAHLQHDFVTNAPISSGAEKITSAR